MAWPKYRKTPARMAAIKRAQLASAAKRKGTGKKKPSGGMNKKAARSAKRVATKKAIANEKARKKKIVDSGRYRGRGGFANAVDDMSKSKGIYERNRKGKRSGKVARTANKVSAFQQKGNPAYAVSKYRRKKRGRK